MFTSTTNLHISKFQSSLFHCQIINCQILNTMSQIVVHATLVQGPCQSSPYRSIASAAITTCTQLQLSIPCVCCISCQSRPSSLSVCLSASAFSLFSPHLSVYVSSLLHHQSPGGPFRSEIVTASSISKSCVFIFTYLPAPQGQSLSAL
jgi:hypothetical protein